MVSNNFEQETDVIVVHRRMTERLLGVYSDHETSSAHAWWLLESVVQKSRSHIILSKQPLHAEQCAWLSCALDRMIIDHMPIQYILGSVPFINLAIHIVPPVLIPRNETEAWVAQCIADYQSSSDTPRHILDLCTGSGCIALAFAQAFPQSFVDAVDCDERAVDLAEKNRCMHGLDNVAVLYGDLFAPLSLCKKYDLIVANPPYIPLRDYYALDPSVRAWEAAHALTGGIHGTDVIERIVQEAPSRLFEGGRLVIEIDATQGDRVMNLFHEHQFSDIHVLRDDNCHDRVVTGVYRKSKHGISL